MAFFKCNGLWCRRWAALRNPDEASETSFHLPVSYAEDVGRKHASLQRRWGFFPPHLAQRVAWLMTCAPTLTRPPLLPPSLFCVIGSFLSDKNFTFDSFVTLTSSFVGFEKWERCGLQRFLILNKVWFHPCNCTTHPQLQAAPWWNICSPHVCIQALSNLFKLSRVRMIVVSGFLDWIKTVLTVWISTTI